MRWSACIEMLFAEHADFAARIRAAKAAGLDAVEFWRFSNKDLPAVKAALRETGLPLAGLLSEISPLTDPSRHDEAVAGLRASIAAAQDIGAGIVIVCTGDVIPGIAREDQRASIVAALRAGAELAAGTGVVLALEPLNDGVDHKGYFLTSTVEALDIVDEVGKPEMRLLYDMYHSAMMGENASAVLKGRVDRVAHVHLADAPGRGEPGSGAMDWRERLGWIEAQGYRGYVGLEYRPTVATEATLGFRF